MVVCTSLFTLARYSSSLSLFKTFVRQRGHAYERTIQPTFTRKIVLQLCLSSSTTSSQTPVSRNLTSEDDNDEYTTEESATSIMKPFSPWNNNLSPSEKNEKVIIRRQFRQHVNPLAFRYQQPTLLSPHWPKDVYREPSLPLVLDIGCGKGGFLLEFAQKYHQNENTTSNEVMMTEINERRDASSQQHAFNFLGLEIRPFVIRYAQSRIDKHGLTGQLDFVGCNANVDLGRLLQLYHEAAATTATTAAPETSDPSNHDTAPAETEKALLHLVTIQFPDPHFKSHHVKRRVVTPTLVQTICQYMPPKSRVFLQSDVKFVLDDMRMQFRQHGEMYLDDVIPDVNQYVEHNVLGVSTEREQSVLKRNLPVYRAVLLRNEVPTPPPPPTLTPPQ